MREYDIEELRCEIRRLKREVGGSYMKSFSDNAVKYF